jgi:WD40 repeat protein
VNFISNSRWPLFYAGTGQELLTLKGHTDPVNYVAFSPDGKRIASGCDVRDSTKQRNIRGEVKLWNAETGREILTLVADREKVHEVVFSPNGQRLAAACFHGTVKVWDTATGQAVFTLRGHTSLVYGVAFSPDGKRLASASWDNTVMLWDTATGLEVLTLRGFPSGVWSVAFSPDGKRLAATGDNGLVMIWDADSGE